MKWNVGTKISVGFALVLTVFIIVSALCYRGLTQLVEAMEWRKHSYEESIKLDSLLANVKDVELGQRSFVLMGQEAFLKPYHVAVKEIESNLGALRAMSTDSISQQQRLETIAPLIKQRIEVADRIIATRRMQGPETAGEMVKSGAGKALMD
jgi:CHASE3 domain sensor protein